MGLDGVDPDLMPAAEPSHVEFHSRGHRLSGALHRPDSIGGPWPAIVQGPGWMGLSTAALYKPYHEAFTRAGFAVITFDYRGFGGSEGTASVDPADQVEDWRNAVAFAATIRDIDDTRIAVFGSGGTGGGNAIVVASGTSAVNGVVAQLPIADGGRWLQGMRSANEWASFAASFDQDRRRRVLGGEGGTIAPRGELQIATRERLNTNLKSDVDSKVPERVSMESAEGLLRYRPIESADRVAGLFVIAVADDDVTPTRDAVELFDRARSPKLLLIQRNTTHYAAYAQYQRQVIPLMVAWLTGLHAGASEQRVTEAIGSVDVTNFDLRTAW